MNSAIYTGIVRHRRLLPRVHVFQYRLYMVYLDLAELAQVFALSPLWSMRRLAPARFRREDFLGPHDLPLDTAVRACISEQTGVWHNGPIRLLTNLRYFGTLMNPISCYYCFDEEENLRYIVAEVSSTPWGERVSYVIPCQQGVSVHSHSFQKEMHVSPFMAMEQVYQWRNNRPDKRLTIHLQNFENDRKIFDATLSLHRREISAGSLNAILLQYPLMSLRTAFGIYWQALRLFLKRLPVYPHQPLKRTGETIKS